MNDIVFYQTSLQEARELADLTSLISDMKQVADFTKLNLSLSEEQEIPKIALFKAALITYRRCFTSGVRSRLTRDDIISLPGEPGEFHDLVRNLTDKLIAHSVNPFEGALAGVAVQDKSIIGTISFGVELCGWQPIGLRQLAILADMIVQKVLTPRLEKAKEALLAAAKAIPIGEITSTPVIRYTAPVPDQAGNRRA
ncbi:MAG TPA: hypothetical protein VL402_11010 [Xanthobacteraceae bacterium]|nr:hypothetical protein [Xanthobacteraceae bacterium]